MKVFKFISGKFYYIFAAKDQAAAKELLFSDIGEMPIDSVEEIPESEWDKTFKIHEDNDEELEEFQMTIRESIIGEEPQFICTNDDAAVN